MRKRAADDKPYAVGQTVLYLGMPGRVYSVVAVQETTSGTAYRFSVPMLYLPGRFLTIQCAYPRELRAVDDLELPEGDV